MRDYGSKNSRCSLPEHYVMFGERTTTMSASTGRPQEKMCGRSWRYFLGDL